MDTSVSLLLVEAKLQKPHKPTNLVWRKVFAKNKESFVDSAPIPLVGINL